MAKFGKKYQEVAKQIEDKLYEVEEAIDLAKKTATAKLVDTTCGVNHFLFTCVERVALGAHFNVEAFFAHGRFGHKSVAARAGHFQIGVFRMDTGFHDFPLGFRV